MGLQALRGAREGIKAAVARCEELLSHMEVAQQVEGIILQGPGPDVAPFLDALSRLDTSIAFLSSSRLPRPACSACFFIHPTARFAANLSNFLFLPPLFFPPIFFFLTIFFKYIFKQKRGEGKSCSCKLACSACDIPALFAMSTGRYCLCKPFGLLVHCALRHVPYRGRLCV